MERKPLKLLAITGMLLKNLLYTKLGHASQNVYQRKVIYCRRETCNGLSSSYIVRCADQG